MALLLHYFSVREVLFMRKQTWSLSNWPTVDTGARFEPQQSVIRAYSWFPLKTALLGP